MGTQLDLTLTDSPPASQRASRGFALVASLLLLLLLSAIALGTIYLVQTESSLGGNDLESNVAYYGAEAAMEKMMVDLGNLYLTRAAPTVAEINGLGAAAFQPTLPGITYPGYTFTLPICPQPAPAICTGAGAIAVQVRTISSGPNQGLVAQIIPITLNVSAHRQWGAEVKMVRNVEVALIPVFQFGIFSDSDLSYFPGPLFDFAGRVHTNGNLFLAGTSGVTFHSKITAARDVIRVKMANTADTVAQGRTGFIKIPTAPNGCDGAQPACRSLAVGEGSLVSGVGSAQNGSWTNISQTTYNGLILNSKTGARTLTLPFVAPGLTNIEIVRRPWPGEDPASLVAQSRLYSIAEIRILISDNQADLPIGGVRLANVAPYFVAGLYGASNTAFAEGNTTGETADPLPCNAVALNAIPNTGNGCVAASAFCLPGQGVSAGKCAGFILPAAVLAGTPWPLIDGWLLVQKRLADGTYTDVTMEWLNFGIARGALDTARTFATGFDNSVGGIGWGNTVNRDAILRFQTYRYNGDTGVQPVGLAKNNSMSFYPTGLYDTREGEFRDTDVNIAAGATPFFPSGSGSSCALNGIMKTTELDIGNLRRWFCTSTTGTITATTQCPASLIPYPLTVPGPTGLATDSSVENGYIVYFSDRRGMRLDTSIIPNRLTGAYGYEDVINPATTTGAPNATLDAGEDFNESGTLQTFGAGNIGDAFGLANGNPALRVDCRMALKNKVSAARRALKLVDADLGKLPLGPGGNGGFTVASENPVYVMGDFNANAASNFTEGSCSTAVTPCHAATSVTADMVTLLSSNWLDWRSWKWPTTRGNRTPVASYYRLAIAAGKNAHFPQPGFAGVAQDYGEDGGVHNFLRFLENWGGIAVNYRGSLVSLYYSQYSDGVYKCCATVYGAPSRNYSFDIDFLNPSLLPPGTPKFRDMVNVGFQQIFTPY